MAAGIHGDHLDGMQIVRREAELAAEEAKGAAGHVPAHADPGIFASGMTTPQVSNSVRNASPTVAPASTATARLSAS